MLCFDPMAEAASKTRNEADDLMETEQTIPFETLAIAESSEYVTAVETRPYDGSETASLSDQQSSSADEFYMTARRIQLGELRSKCTSEEEFELEKSREHWTEVGTPCSEEDLLVVENRRHFQSLLKKFRMSRRSRRFHKRWENLLPKHEFFRDYGDSLEVGRKIAEGGQAEVLEATLDGKENCVVKVFKSNLRLSDLQRQWIFTPHGDTLSGKNSSWKLFRNKCCFIKGGTLLKDGRFAFVMKRYWGDLRKLIDLKMEQNHHARPPFPYPLPIMLEIALGMKDLHKNDILHRDLKASNVLVGSSDNSVSDAEMKLEASSFEDMEEGVLDKKASARKKLNKFYCYIADFESSNDCRGTAFWRAPEVLRAVQNHDSDRNIWTKKVDVYSYGMTCYEVLTGRLPLENLLRTDYDAVIVRGERPPLPDYIDDQVQDLLRRCWHSEPSGRPTFVQIVRELEALRRSKPTFFFNSRR